MTKTPDLPPHLEEMCREAIEAYKRDHERNDPTAFRHLLPYFKGASVCGL